MSRHPDNPPASAPATSPAFKAVLWAMAGLVVFMAITIVLYSQWQQEDNRQAGIGRELRAHSVRYENLKDEYQQKVATHKEMIHQVTQELDHERSKPHSDERQVAILEDFQQRYKAELVELRKRYHPPLQRLETELETLQQELQEPGLSKPAQQQ